MSRRASILAKQQRSRPKVRFPDDLVFLDNIRENDLDACKVMLRRASLKIDINALNDAGLTPLHQAVLDGNLPAVKLLVEHGANVNERDADTWTPLHAACAEGHADIVRYLLTKGANKDMMSCEGERPLDLVDSADLHTIGAMLESVASRGLSSGAHSDDDDHKASSPPSSPSKRRQTGKSSRDSE